jgi:hypothetical protein
MLIETEIVFTDESQSNIMGRDVNHTDTLVFELEDVSGIMPGDKDKKSSIIFLHGRDLLVNLPFLSLLKQYKKVKDSDVHFSPEAHEG